MPLRAAVVGTHFGARVHVPALQRAGFEVVALVGRTKDKTAHLATKLGVERPCASLDEALELGVDAVTIATPPDTHAVLAHAVVAAGRHVVCEKPFTVNADEAESLTAAADRAGVVALVGHEFRFAEDRATAARAIAAGAIGEPRFATFLSYVPLVADPTTPMPEWWFDKYRGGGWLGASGSHVVDEVRSWLGDFE